MIDVSALVDAVKLAKGDKPGHPFRGNQWSKGGGGGAGGKVGDVDAHGMSADEVKQVKEILANGPKEYDMTIQSLRDALSEPDLDPEDQEGFTYNLIHATSAKMVHEDIASKVDAYMANPTAEKFAAIPDISDQTISLSGEGDDELINVGMTMMNEIQYGALGTKGEAKWGSSGFAGEVDWDSVNAKVKTALKDIDPDVINDALGI